MTRADQIRDVHERARRRAELEASPSPQPRRPPPTTTRHERWQEFMRQRIAARRTR